MQTKSPVFEDISNLMANAFGAAKGVGDEVRAAARARAQTFISEMDLVSRDEFEVVKAMAMQARMDVDALKAEIEALKATTKTKRKPARKSTKKSPKKSG